MFGKQLAPVRSIAAFFALTTIFAMIVLTRSGQAQTFTVLHAFTGGGDGGNPYAGVTLDGAGNLYGTTTTNSVYKLTHRSGGWTFARLYNSGSYGGLTIGPNGTFYGINASSAVFNLQPPPHFVPNLFAPWIETTLYSLPAGSYAGVVFDRAGNIYGTTYDGGTYGLGTVFELSPSNGGWTETVLHTFGNGFDGQFPYAGLVVDDAGNLYGTTIFGGAYGNGTVFELSPSAGGWTESFIYSFTGGADGANPYGELIFDSSGNLYGATPGTFGQGASTVFKLTPSDGTWAFSLVYSVGEEDSCGTRGTLAMDGAGNLYGTTYCLGASGGSGLGGSVFELTPSDNGTWTYTSLHYFTGSSDGEFPEAGVTLDVSGNLYGTTTVGGQYRYGTVWEITP